MLWKRTKLFNKFKVNSPKLYAKSSTYSKEVRCYPTSAYEKYIYFDEEYIHSSCTKCSTSILIKSIYNVIEQNCIRKFNIDSHTYIIYYIRLGTETV